MNGEYLLDTNIPSELTRPLPNAGVSSWLEARSGMHLSVVSIGELRRGFGLLAYGRRRTQLEQWLEHFLVSGTGPAILPVTRGIAERWGEVSAESQLRGRTLDLADSLIAATALEHNLTLVTRNTRDFADHGVTLFNPWESN